MNPKVKYLFEKFPDTMTLGEVRQYLRDNLEQGCDCPACTRYGQIYDRKIYKTMCRVLIRLWILRKFEVTDINEFCKAQRDFKAGAYGDFSKFKYWGIVEQMAGEREDGSKRIGKYRITTHGSDFVRNVVAVPKECSVYDDWVLRWHPKKITIKEVLEAKRGGYFDYAALMKWKPPEE